MRLGKLTNRWFSLVLTRVSFQLDALYQKVSEILFSIRSKMNMLAPMSRLPQDVLTLIPDFLNESGREKVTIVLSHVCRAWREMLVSRASLWTDFRCMDAEKTRVYLERSKSSPITLSLQRTLGFFPGDPFFQITPYLTSRLSNLSVATTPNHLQDITNNFIYPAPLLEALTIDGSFFRQDSNPVLTTALFGGDLSSLREFHLRSVRTELSWRNMNNLTSFSLFHVAHPPSISVEHILDFFESAPHLREVELLSAAPTVHAQNGRLLSLSQLKTLSISGCHSPSVLLDYLVIPVGTKVSVEWKSPRSRFDDHLPTSLDNLRNLSNFTEIRILSKTSQISIRFAGPSGEASFTFQVDSTIFVRYPNP